MKASDALEVFKYEIQLANSIALSVVEGIDFVTLDAFYEAALMKLVRAYENFNEHVFVGILTGDSTSGAGDDGRAVFARDEAHAQKILNLSSAGQFVDWSAPEIVAERSQTLVVPDTSLELALRAKTQHLKWARQIRNHIAHNSVTSLVQYRKVAKSIYAQSPNPLPNPGTLLRDVPDAGPCKGQEVFEFLCRSFEEFGEAAITNYYGS